MTPRAGVVPKSGGRLGRAHEVCSPRPRYGPIVRTTRYVALLRGINVGGRNMVAMADLREAFEADGYEAVSTYIQWPLRRQPTPSPSLRWPAAPTWTPATRWCCSAIAARGRAISDRPRHRRL